MPRRSLSSSRTRSIALQSLLGLVLSALLAPVASAGSVATPNTFTDGDVASASTINSNFSAHESEINDNDARIDSLLTRVAALEATVVAQASAIVALESNTKAAVTGVVDSLGVAQFVSNGSVTVARIAVGRYEITIPAGILGGIAVPVFTPVNSAVGVSTTVSTFSGGVQTTTVTFRTSAGTATDSLFHFVAIGNLP